MGGNDSPTPPAPPDYAKLYQSGIDVYLRNLPTLLQVEQDTRATTDPQRIEQQQHLQDLYGPTQVQQQLDALHKFDPESAKIRELLGGNIFDTLKAGGDASQGDVYGQLHGQILSDLQSGYKLPADYARELEQSTRGAQTARGNIYGTGPAVAESAVKGKAALDLYQQHLQNAYGFMGIKSPGQLATENAGNFLAGPTPEQQALAIQGVSPDRSMAYASPGAGTAGANFGLANYQNLLAQNSLVQGRPNPWGSALSGAASGAATGTMISPGWGTLIGGIVGGAAGYFGSDEAIKSHITDTGKRHRGIRVVEFNYKGNPQRFRGVIAQEVEKIMPAAVKIIDGIRFVNYNLLGLEMEPV